MQLREYPTVQKTDPLAERGAVIFVNVRPNTKIGAWICDECLACVRPSEFVKHVGSLHRKFAR